MKVLVVSDTHIHDESPRRLPSAVLERAAQADAIIHAGDIVGRRVLDELAEFAPVHAVLGNNDDAELAGMLPETFVHEFDGVRVGAIHDSGPRLGREGRMRRRFPDADVVVFGHSHVPHDAPGADGQLLFNPGSPTQRRRQPRHTLGTLQLEDGVIVDHRIVPID